MTREAMLRLVEEQLRAYNGRELDAFCACYHPEVRVEFLVSRRTAYTGLAEFRAGYERQFAKNPHQRCELRSRVVLESAVLDEELVTELAGFPDGLHTTAIYGFRDGLIDCVWFAR